MPVPKGKPFTQWITQDNGIETLEFTADTSDSDAVDYDEQIQKVLLAASQIEDDKVRTLVVRTIMDIVDEDANTCTIQ